MTARAARSPLTWLAALLALYLVVPVAGLLVRLGSQPRGTGLGAPGLASALGVSLLTASVSTFLIGLFGIPLAYLLARSRGRLAGLVGMAVQLPLALPPLMSGILLIYVVGPYTPLGGTLGLTESLAGIVIAQTFVASPFLIVAARSAFAAVDPRLTDVAATLGLGDLSRFAEVSLPIAAAAIRAGLLLAWLRAFGEFGATVILAYHPYSLPVFTYVQFSGSGLSQTTAPTVLAVLAAFCVLGLSSWQPRRRRRLAGALPAPGSVDPRPPAPISFRIDQRLGEFHLQLAHAGAHGRLAILGPSGSGKTTTLRALAGLLEPGAQEFKVGARSLAEVAAEERRSGYVPQESSLFPHLTVWRQILFGRGARGELASHWLGRLRLGGLEDRRPDQLSGGQRQRVALARALARDPDVLLLDEPFSSLDTPVRAELRRELRRLQLETGVASVLVTHDPEEAALLADELLVIERGLLLQAGTAAEVFARPASPRVALLLGIPNLNSGRMLGPSRLRADGVDLEVAGSGARAGDEVRWCVPAERLSPAPGGAYRARVLDVADVGGALEVTLRLGGIELLARTSRRDGLEAGSECRLDIPPDAVSVWPAEGGPGEDATIADVHEWRG
ncbi:MAG: ATP-binding cassette domain-containing protein [Candidatus Dormibacterales bacterium]